MLVLGTRPYSGAPGAVTPKATYQSKTNQSCEDVYMFNRGTRSGPGHLIWFEFDY